ncbi:MAG: peptide chain release factor N(5)-glutamine methyltransferase [Alphaproteobacteria bacterium]|uniref:Release factor glutamine methyltransferase n=1 Tax=Candidatus Nitrobium versatile TaxID=2884831 RepID=A0A953JF74_9BACT|nr:peptide chain release factor N(5)-glutamine methyltransferase [Candidatus Nitrobium versatile]
MNVLEKLRKIAQVFEESGIENPAKEAEILIAGALPIGPSELYRGDRELSREEASFLSSLAVRRAGGEPLQYILGSVEFFGLKIHVGRGVLIPRPETELLVEETISLLAHRRPPFSILDLCAGSGCIALALAKRFPEAEVYGTDASEAAMVYATQNARENDVRNVRFRLGNLFDPVRDMRFDCIVSNPPYIRREEIRTLQREVRDFEPVEALDGGPDGSAFYRSISKGAPRHLKDNGVLALEIGYGQSREVERLIRQAGFQDIRIIKDFSGIERIITGMGNPVRSSGLTRADML